MRFYVESAALTLEVRVIEKIEGLYGSVHKLYIFNQSPYDRTMFIDSDCTFAQDGMDAFWDRFAGNGVGICGSKASKGRYGAVLDFPTALKKYNLPWVVQLNGGLSYFEKGEVFDKFRDTLAKLVDDGIDQVTQLYRAQEGEYNEEPLLGLAMAICGISPIPEELNGKRPISHLLRVKRFDLDFEARE